MMTQSFRCAAAGLLAISSTMLWAAAPPGIEKAAERPAPPEQAAPMEEVLSIGALLTPYVDMEQLEAQVREQTRRMTERLSAAIEAELKEMLAPSLDIEVAVAVAGLERT